MFLEASRLPWGGGGGGGGGGNKINSDHNE